MGGSLVAAGLLPFLGQRGRDLGRRRRAPRRRASSRHPGGSRRTLSESPKGRAAPSERLRTRPQGLRPASGRPHSAGARPGPRNPRLSTHLAGNNTVSVFQGPGCREAPSRDGASTGPLAIVATTMADVRSRELRRHLQVRSARPPDPQRTPPGFYSKKIDALAVGSEGHRAGDQRLRGL